MFTDRRALLRGFQEQESEIQIAGNGFAKNGGKQWPDSVLEKKASECLRTRKEKRHGLFKWLAANFFRNAQDDMPAHIISYFQGYDHVYRIKDVK